MIYITLTALFIVNGFVCQIFDLRIARRLLIAVILTAALAAYLRGLSGTDTHTYITIVDNFVYTGYLKLEIGFKTLVGLLTIFTENAQHIVRLCSAFFFSILLIFAANADKNQAIYLIAYFAPQYFINYSMNGIRIGLATAAFLVFYQNLSSRNWVRAVIFGLISISFHYSVIICFLFLATAIYMKSNNLTFGKWLVVAIFCCLSLFLASNYIDSKIDEYTAERTSNEFMGGSSFLKVAILVFFAKFLPAEKRSKYLLSSFILLVTIVLLYISSFNYAGVRLMDLLVWLIPLMYITLLPEREYMGKKCAVVLTLTGIVGAAFVLNNIFSDIYGPSPFNPYFFIWE